MPFPNKANTRHTNVLVNLVGGFRLAVATSLTGSRRSIVPQRVQVLNLSRNSQCSKPFGNFGTYAFRKLGGRFGAEVSFAMAADRHGLGFLLFLADH